MGTDPTTRIRETSDPEYRDGSDATEVFDLRYAAALDAIGARSEKRPRLSSRHPARVDR
jgi:hypothetical protein